MEQKVKEAFERELQTMKMEYSLYEFLKGAWPAIEGELPFSDGWHIEIICSYLEEAFERRIRKLLINVPPRTSKTSIISVAFPAWVWLHSPHEKFMYASYASSLSIEHSLKCRRLIESDWYQKLWGKKVKLSRDQRAKGFFENDKKGYRIATSVGASSTGKGANFLVADDPNNVKDGESPIKRYSTNAWWNQVWSTRLNDSKNDVRIIVQQRVHEQDISGDILNNDINDDWVKLILPMEYEKARFKINPNFPQLQEKKFQDPRTEDGQLLCNERFPKKEIESLKHQLGTYGYAGQFQQRPSPEEGGIIKKAWFRWWKEPDIPDIKLVIQSWDTAYSDKSTSDYSACTTWGIFYDENEIENVILLSSWRGHVGFPDLRERALRLFHDYRDVHPEKNQKFSGRDVDVLLIEAKASGDSLIQVMRQAGIPAQPIRPKENKIRRVHLVTHLIEGGCVWMPARPKAYTRLYPFAEEFLEACSIFPNSDSCDLVDTMSQALSKMREGNVIEHPRDRRPEVYRQPRPRIY